MKEQLVKYFTGSLTDAEKLDLFRQVEKDTVLRDEMADIQNAMALSGFMDSEGDSRMVAEKMKQLNLETSKRGFLRVLYSISKYAIASILVICTWFLSERYAIGKQDNEMILIEAPLGQRVYLTLSDGTEVWLSSRTKLKIPNLFNKKERIIELDGEGFFSVKKDSRPFIVKTQQYNVQVLGTQFNVFAYSESPDFETDLLNGSVYVYPKNNEKNGLFMKPNEKIYLSGGELHKSVHAINSSEFIKNGIFIFEEKPFGELLNRLELWYNVKFIVTRPALREYAFSGKFRQSDDIASILQAIQEVGKFEFRKITEHEIEIY